MGVVQFFNGKTIFITGATGFMGIALIEKLLRSCPGIEKIYVLLRPKKGCSIEERLEKFKELEVFRTIKKNNPDVLNKVIGIQGDVSYLNLGLSDSDRQLLVDNVNIIYHLAASVRFDDFFEVSIKLNVRGTREVAQLALDLKNPIALVHISTAFSNIFQNELEERLYSPHADWKDAILLAETCDKELLHKMTEKYIYPYPNTYTFAKGLGEHVVNDMCKGKIQTIITRPSIVVNSLEEPIPGWNDNLNGPISLMIASGKGLIRVVLGQCKCRLNFIPVDVAIKGIILSTYNSTIKNNKEEVDVYNITQCTINTTQGEFYEIAADVSHMSPFPNAIMYPNPEITACSYNYYIKVLLLHMLPAMVLDLLLRLSGRKPMVVRLQRKVFIANCILRYFTLQNFVFNNDKMIDMQKNLKEDERDFHYPHELTDEEIFYYLIQSKIGVCLYVLKEPIDPTGRKEFKNIRRLWLADILFKTIIYVFLSWLLLVKWNLLRTSIDYFSYYIENI